MADPALVPAPTTPTVQAPAPVPTPPSALPLSTPVFVAVVIAVALLLVVVLARLGRKAPELPAKEAEKLPAPPERIPEIPLELPPSEALQKAEAELVRQQGERDGLRAKGLDDKSEDFKKAEYRVKKAQESVDRERKRVEAEARAKAEAEAKAREAAEAAAKKAAEEEAQRKRVEAVAGKTLAEGLDKTRAGFMGKLGALFGAQKQVDEKTLAELEEILFTADIGVKTATDLFEVARERVKKKELADGDKLKGALRGEIERILALPGAGAIPAPSGKPLVIMVVGVNGAGKTTTIGKLSAQYVSQGKKVILGAGDTFRAAATEQLEVWAGRAGVPIIKGLENSDPGAVVFDAVKKGATDQADVVICDTAGRLHTKAPLMEELKKVKRVMDKAVVGAPHEVLLVLDATNGQNAIAQARQFHEALGVTGIALTKLDGTAKGGVIIGICDELKIPVRYVGVGEAIEDLRAFEPHEFVQALFT
ncbi:MAG: signal recognition particle-docking protein FtsY [Deltaproteobacteria bacterium]|nr:signal recognition particle-docking protein FtsY [Deltaproteobacteria bacterium]